ncbi:hypothetical protein XENOCAPTIV_009908 [Xenoophorus captivus]|uniref:Uncharacterized protein n=1 Tax=Xenoophorus captivus TaxID=1517983 RepID=A0ABV0SB61_9TELE
MRSALTMKNQADYYRLRSAFPAESASHLPRILLTQPWLTRSCLEMSQGRTPWWASSTIRCLTTSGRGLPLLDDCLALRPASPIDASFPFLQLTPLKPVSEWIKEAHSEPTLPTRPCVHHCGRSRILQWITLSLRMCDCVCSRDQPEAAWKKPASCFCPSQTANSFQSHVSNMGNRASVQWAADMC